MVEFPLEVWLGLKEPHAPVLPHVTDQFTRAEEPLFTVATNECVALIFKDAGGVEAKKIESWEVTVDWPPPHPAISPAPNSRKYTAHVRIFPFHAKKP